MASTTFENKLNAAIEEKGYRISPRLGLEDRLARYIELTWIDRGEPLTSDEIDAVVALTMVNNFGAEETESQEPRRSARVASRQTQSYTDDSEETWQPRRSSRIAASSRNITATDDSVRVSFATGAHPMVRRSQVVRR